MKLLKACAKEGKIMYCKRCGKEIEEDCLVCPECGTTQSSETKTERGKGENPLWTQVKDTAVQVGTVLIAVIGQLLIGKIGKIGKKETPMDKVKRAIENVLNVLKGQKKGKGKRK
jgi:uncharacterized membrane protein YvbJ